jgi:hypothetical protein
MSISHDKSGGRLAGVFRWRKGLDFFDVVQLAHEPNSAWAIVRVSFLRGCGGLASEFMDFIGDFASLAGEFQIA